MDSQEIHELRLAHIADHVCDTTHSRCNVPRLLLFLMEVTLAIIKPDALEAGYKKEIMHIIKKYKFVVLKYGRIKLTRLRAEEFYADHEKDAPYYELMIQYMMRRPIFVMVLARENCIQAFRNLMGPKDATKARKTHPLSLRALFGKEGRFNAIHGSDSKEMAQREIKFFFPDMILESYPAKEDANKYFKDMVNPVLIKGLAALAKAKPSSDSIATCKWLARWLHDNNPKLPKLSADVIPDCLLIPEDMKRPTTRPPSPMRFNFSPPQEIHKDPSGFTQFHIGSFPPFVGPKDVWSS